MPRQLLSSVPALLRPRFLPHTAEDTSASNTDNTNSSSDYSCCDTTSPPSNRPQFGLRIHDVWFHSILHTCTQSFFSDNNGSPRHRCPNSRAAAAALSRASFYRRQARVAGTTDPFSFLFPLRIITRREKLCFLLVKEVPKDFFSETKKKEPSLKTKNNTNGREPHPTHPAFIDKNDSAHSKAVKVPTPPSSRQTKIRRDPAQTPFRVPYLRKG